MRARGEKAASTEPHSILTAPYSLLSPMGTTAYGMAFRARHVAQGREVALHFLAREDDADGAFSRALPVAVAKCAQLSHNNVIALLEHGRDEVRGRFYLVTEPLEGASLAAELDDRGTLALARALTIAQQIGRALRAAHKLGIVHGALTPENVRLVSSEPGEVARVVGFGCATFAPPGTRSAEVRARESAQYVTPEVAAGAQPDARDDVFALASLLYRMLSGRAPDVQRERPAPLLSTLSAEPVPMRLDELVARCLDPNPEARLSDLLQITRELREIATSIHPELGEIDSLAPGPSSLPAQDLPTAEGDLSGSIHTDTGPRRGGALWVFASLLLALAAVWILWEASQQRMRPRGLVPERTGLGGARR